MCPVLLDQIARFFEHYKDLESGRWVKVQRWGEAEEATDLIRQGMERARNADTKKLADKAADKAAK